MVCLLTAQGKAQNLVVNGTFSTPPVTQSVNWGYFPASELSPWQTQEAVFELWTNGLVAPAAYLTNAVYSAPGCNQNLEIEAETGPNTVWQTVPTVAGEMYLFSFYHTPRPHYSSQLTVSINSNVVASIYENADGLTNFDWRQFTTNFVAIGNLTTLAFADVPITMASAGAHIDGVVLEHVPRLAIGALNAPGFAGSWLGVSNEIYQLQYSTNLTALNWVNWGPPVQSDSTTNFTFTDTMTNTPQKYYRVLVDP